MATILVVDDQPINREFLITLLGYCGHRLLEAGDGAEALALVHTEQPDLVIADILMPTMDGYEFVRQLRSNPATAQILVMFYTAYYHEQKALALAQACGVHYILTKPSEPEVVLRMVDQALGLMAPPAPAIIQDTFDREHLRLLTDTLSQQAQVLQKTNLQLTALIDISLQLASERDPERLLEHFCATARDLIGARYAAVGIAGDDQQSLRHFFISGMDAELSAAIGTPAAHPGPLRALIAEQRALRLQNASGDPAALGFPRSYPPLYSLLAAPIVSLSRSYGWIYLTNKLGETAFSDADQQLVTILAAQVGRIYENGSLYHEAQRYAAVLEQEVAERKRAEEALVASQERFRALIENSPDAIALFDIAGRILYGSPANTRILGYPLELLIGTNIFELVHPDDLAGVARKFTEAVKTPSISIQSQARVRHSDGTWRLLESTFTNLLQNPSIHAIVSNYRDVTERRRLEDQFRQAQKMESIGQLAGGIAHDFNNMLSVVIGFVGSAQEQLPANSEVQRALVAAEGAAWRAARLTRQLLTFARKQIVELQVVNLNTVIVDLDTMLRRLINENIILKTMPARDLAHVRVDPGHIEQVIVNMAVNARDAMPNGGQLTIETANVMLDSEYTSQHVGMSPGRYVMLAISDTGMGMDSETQQHIFEPFYTTKEPGKGTGLGLATCYGIVKQHGGTIWVYSEVGQGTTFKVYLPSVEEHAQAPTQPQQVAELPHGTEIILLVEDESLVRELVAKILRGHGYHILESANSDDGLLVAKAHTGPRIDMLITDVVLPGAGGKQLAEQVTRLYPAIKVLFISGYATDAITQHGRLDTGTHFLSKPFTRISLVHKVREVLDA